MDVKILFRCLLAAVDSCIEIFRTDIFKEIFKLYLAILILFQNLNVPTMDDGSKSIVPT